MLPPSWGWTARGSRTLLSWYSPFVGVDPVPRPGPGDRSGYSPTCGGGPYLGPSSPGGLRSYSPFLGVDRLPGRSSCARGRYSPVYGGGPDNHAELVERRWQLISPFLGVGRTHARSAFSKRRVIPLQGVDRPEGTICAWRKSPPNVIPPLWGWTQGVHNVHEVFNSIPPTWGWTAAAVSAHIGCYSPIMGAGPDLRNISDSLVSVPPSGGGPCPSSCAMVNRCRCASPLCGGGPAPFIRATITALPPTWGWAASRDRPRRVASNSPSLGGGPVSTQPKTRLHWLSPFRGGRTYKDASQHFAPIGANTKEQ